MREAMYRAEVGDDCYDEDPPVNHLQELAAKRTGKEAARPTSPLTEEALTASAALVHGVRHQRFAALECLAHTRQVDRGGLMAEPVTVLLAGTRTVPSARRRKVPAAHDAAARTITRSLTHGRVGRRRHG